MPAVLLFKRWWRLTPAERRFVAHVCVLLPLCQALLACLPLEKLLRRAVRVAGARELASDRVARLVEAVAAAHPCRPRCLARAIVGVWALRESGAQGELVIGRLSASPFQAHAWVRDGSRVLIGGAGAAGCRELHAVGFGAAGSAVQW